MKYRYNMSGTFTGDNNRTYEINIPSPNTYESEAETMEDSSFGYRFVSVHGEPVVAIYGKENYRMETQDEAKDRAPALLTWVVGTPIAMYTYNDFKAKGGYMRLLKAEKEGSGYIDGETDFEDTNDTFKDIFPECEKWDKSKYIDNEAYYITKVVE